MSKSAGGKRKPKGKKLKPKDPVNEALEKTQKDVKSLREEVSRRIFSAENAENRRHEAYTEQVKSAKRYEELQRSTQDHTAFLITENEIKVTNLQDDIQRLGDKLDRANKSLEIKTSELKKLHQEFEDYIKENDLKISALEQKLKEQAALFRDVMSQAFTQLTERLSIDYENIHNNFKIFSKSTSDLIELEFLNPPFLDEESANNM
ncbi:hypothetical protein EWB00_006587 [Schistosoma japonicum]|uniref:Coiled-coil domain-containing protein 153 n=1 Tax=Schistosoma japonicum TaxID=6182 RepID=A0A4Z2DT99_SCHJA|nr:hypothetical protein EWB00_006587 [Schistosoma japonicum]